jgi:hypothetical protein
MRRESNTLDRDGEKKKRERETRELSFTTPQLYLSEHQEKKFFGVRRQGLSIY